MKNSKNKSYKYICISIMLVTLCSPAMAINKCKDKNGGVFYQDIPCDDGVKLDLPRDSQPDQKSKDPLQIKLESLRIERQNLINSNIARGKVAVGMTAEEVRRSWGSPTKINSSIGSYGKHEQWIYDRGNFVSQYVYVDNGKVTSVQSSD